MDTAPVLTDILVCPESHGKLRSGISGNGNVLKCNDCGKEYHFINAIYITDRCIPNKCKKECLSACKAGKMEYRTWTKSSKKVCIMSCNGCGDCIKVCPFEAIVVHKTPSFLDASTPDDKLTVKTINHQLHPTELLRKPENLFMCGHVAATYSYVSSKIEEFAPDFVVDDGCGHNLFAAKYGVKRTFVSLDARIDHHAYRKVDILANGEKLPLASDSVPLFISNFVLEHIKNPRIYLKEIKRVLAKNGALIISTPTQYWHFINFFSLFATFEYLINIFKNPLIFVKNPWKHLIQNRSHEKDHCLDNSKEGNTVLNEVHSWRIDNWRTLYKSEGFRIISEKATGNLFSGHHLRFCGLFCNHKKMGAHITFVLNVNK